MVVGMQGKGKTTLLKRLKAKGVFKESSFTDTYRLPSSPSGNTVGIKTGTWSYCKYRKNPTDEYPKIEFYTWDFFGEVSLKRCCNVCLHDDLHKRHYLGQEYDTSSIFMSSLYLTSIRKKL